MYIDFLSDWPAYLFMLLFVVFFVYIIAKGQHKQKQESVRSKDKIVE
ncbi:MAG: hypothetical protein LE168_01045 [Endomicrobium sp.]|nr:hypothetical protein [Endomicrobium sp.]